METWELEKGPHFLSTFYALFLNLKILKIHFHVIPLWSILVCKIHFSVKNNQFGQIFIFFQKVDTVILLINMFCPPAQAKNPFFLGPSSWPNKGRQLPRKERLNTQVSFKIYLTICDLSFNVQYNLNYLYFKQNKRPSARLSVNGLQSDLHVYRHTSIYLGVLLPHFQNFLKLFNQLV